MRHLALIVILTSCTLPQMEQTGSAARDVAPIVDAVLSAIAPPLARVEGAVDGFEVGVERVLEQRLARGEDPEAPVNWEEWAGIAGLAILGALGYVRRSNTRKAQMEAMKKDVQDSVLRMGGKDPRFHA